MPHHRSCSRRLPFSPRDFLLPWASRNEAAAALIRGLRDELPDLVRQRSFLPEYRRRSILLGQPVRVLPVGQEPYEAVAESIDEEAALVETAGAENPPANR